MPKLAAKHENGRTIAYTNFSGGLNLALTPEAIADNELQLAENLEFDPKTGGLRLRGGLEKVHEFSGPVTDLLTAPESGVLLAKSSGHLHTVKLSGNSNVFVEETKDLGLVEGDGPGVSELWDDGLLLAFGGGLYKYKIGVLTKITAQDAPTRVDVLFVRAGRVAVAQAGSDTLRFSGVGDPTRWTTGNDSDSVSLDIGYKDGCSIRAVVPIVGEVIVFKSPPGQPERGRIYRLQGDYPKWSVIAYSKGAGAWNPCAAAAVGGDVIFLTKEGMGNLATATEFGDFKLRWAGTKVNPRLSPSLSEECRIWPLAGRSQVWLGTDADYGDTVWCWHYEIGAGGAWTTLKFPGHVASVAQTQGRTYLAIGNTIWHLNENLADDSGTAIIGRLRPKMIMGSHQLLLKGVVARYYASELSKVSVLIEGLELRLPSDFADDVAFSDNDIAFFDNDPLVPSQMGIAARRRCNIRRWNITPEFVIRNGLFHVASMELNIAEV